MQCAAASSYVAAAAAGNGNNNNVLEFISLHILLFHARAASFFPWIGVRSVARSPAVSACMQLMLEAQLSWLGCSMVVGGGQSD